MKKVFRGPPPHTLFGVVTAAWRAPFVWIYRQAAAWCVAVYWLLHLYMMQKSVFYRERIDRNLGWITWGDQLLIKNAVVGIAGCGGMGGIVAATLARLGVGEIRIADCERYDISNLNRQYGATIRTLGLNKALVLARMLSLIACDSTIYTFPEGITPESVAAFTQGCDVICDEIEFWALGSRILLHQSARKNNVPILCAPTVGHRVYIFLYTATSMTIETVLEMSYSEAFDIQRRIAQKTATLTEIKRVKELMLRYAAPTIPEYSQNPPIFSTEKELRRRLLLETRASIIATNPPMAAGFLANHVLFLLLERSDNARTFVRVPSMPGYLMFDAGLFILERKTDAWWPVKYSSP